MSEFFCPDKNQISPDFSETARYLGYKKSNPPDSTVQELIEKAANQAGQIITPKAVFQEFDLLEDDNSENKILFADVSFCSVDLSHNLKNCKKVILVASTIGPQIDSLIRKTQPRDTVYASVLQATGAMYIERFVDLLNRKIKDEAKEKGFTAHPRFSPGYGDVSLDLQKAFFRLLPCNKIGLTLMDTLIMAPEKSVTAFIGLE